MTGISEYSHQQAEGKSLRRTLSWYFAIAAFLPVILITGLVLYQFISDKISDLSDKNLLIARATRGQVEVYLNEPVTVLQNISNMLLSNPNLKSTDIKPLLKNHVRHSRLLESIYVLNEKGIVESVGLKPDKEIFENDYIGISLAHKDFYARARHSQEPTWSDTFLSLISGKMSLALCLAVDKRVLVGNFNLELLSSFIDQITLQRGLTITIVDRGGAIVAQSGNNVVGRQVKVNHIELFQLGLAGNEATRRYSFNDTDYIGSVSGIPGPGWAAAVSQKTDDLYRPFTLIAIYIIIGTLGTVILAILFGMISSRKLSQPLTEFSQQTKIVARGEYDTKIDQPGYMEVLDLADSFRSMVTNIQDREQRLKDSEQRYRMLFERSNDGIFVIDRHSGQYLDANEAGLRLAGRSLSELQALKTFDVTPEGARERLDTMAHSSRTESFGQVTYYRPDGTKRIALVTTMPVDEETIVGMARDITDELALEDQLRQGQKLEAIGTLAGGIAHDFNNILAAILGYSELVLDELAADNSIRNKIEAIHSSGERARDLVAQILAFSRKDEQVRAPVEMNLLIKDALMLLRPAIPTTIDIQSVITSKCKVLGDPTRLHQIIMNLCTNAYQAMVKTGGKLKISLDTVSLSGSEAMRAQVPEGGYSKLIIADSGVGIPPENLERIFEPYFTTKEKGKGSGLGLAAVHGIVQSHEGNVLVESAVGKGTRFIVYLPLTGDTCRVEKEPETEMTGGQERILMVDDEQDILNIQRAILERIGYDVTSESDGKKALALFADQPGAFDLIVADMTMPHISGDILAADLLEIRPDIPIILCTGFSELMTEEKAVALGVKGFLTKPVSVRDFAKVVRSVLDK